MNKEIDTKALNEKIAKWIGFKFVNIKNHYDDGSTFNGWKSPLINKNPYSYTLRPELPDLVNSLDAQAKWIWPELTLYGYAIEINVDIFGKIWCSLILVMNNYSTIQHTDKNAALAFALAVEKLIDSLDKDNNNVNKTK
jgi:hypothetical protein